MIPCKNCLLLPVCRHKNYNELMKCQLVKSLLYYKTSMKLNKGPYYSCRVINFDRIMSKVEKAIKPSTWRFDNGHIVSNSSIERIS